MPDQWRADGMIARLAEALRRLETSSIGEAVRMTPHLYPILESLHVLGIALLVGSAVAVDLRLLGIGRSVLPVTVVAGYLLPLARIGFGLAAVTGVTMFTGIAVSVAQQRGRAMEIRNFILFAGVNVLVFRAGVYRAVATWDLHAPTPIQAKAAALVSACTWMGVIVAGLSYYYRRP